MKGKAGKSVLTSKIETEIDLLQRHVAMLKAIMDNEPIGIIRLSEMREYPQHKARYSLRILERLMDSELDHLIESARRTFSRDLAGATPASGELTFPANHLRAWMSALNQARIVLSEQHQFDADDMRRDAFAPGSPRVAALLQVQVLERRAFAERDAGQRVAQPLAASRDAGDEALDHLGASAGRERDAQARVGGAVGAGREQVGEDDRRVERGVGGDAQHQPAGRERGVERGEGVGRGRVERERGGGAGQ